MSQVFDQVQQLLFASAQLIVYIILAVILIDAAKKIVSPAVSTQEIKIVERFIPVVVPHRYVGITARGELRYE